MLNPPSYICTVSPVPNLYPTVLHKCILFSIAEYGGRPCSMHKIVVALKNLTHGLPRTWKRKDDPWRPDRGRPTGTKKCIVCKRKAAMGKAFSNQIVERIRNCWVQIGLKYYLGLRSCGSHRCAHHLFDARIGILK